MAAPLDIKDIRLVSSGPKFEIWQGAKGLARLDWTSNGVVRIMVKGHGHGEFAIPELKRWEDAVKVSPKAQLVIDFWQMEGYDSELRVKMQGWASTRTKQIEVKVLARSKLVVMGVSVANLAVGGIIKAHSRREEFDRECQKLGLPVNPPLEGSSAV